MGLLSNIGAMKGLHFFFAFKHFPTQLPIIFTISSHFEGYACKQLLRLSFNFSYNGMQIFRHEKCKSLSWVFRCVRGNSHKSTELARGTNICKLFNLMDQHERQVDSRSLSLKFIALFECKFKIVQWCFHTVWKYITNSNMEQFSMYGGKQFTSND